jgi:gamma-glutamylputrescine oxidase
VAPEAAHNVPVWGDPRAWGNPPPLDGEVTADFCVIGLGGSGLAAVAVLLEAGASVAGIDAGPVGGGAAGRNGGFLLAGGSRFHHAAADAWGRDRAIAIWDESVAEMDRLERELGPLVRRVGSLRMPADADEAEDVARQRAAMERDGLPVDGVQGRHGPGILVPTDGAIDPLGRCRLLAERAIAAGARLFSGTRAVDVRADRVTCAGEDGRRGEVACRAVIVAVDGGLERLLGELAGRVRTTRLQMLATAPVAERLHPRPVYARWGYDYWQQLPDGRVALGGGRDRHQPDEWDAPPEPTYAVQAELDRLLAEEAGVDAPVEHRWAGVVSFTDDGLPVLEEVRPGVLALGAHNGHGNVLGSAGGRAAAEIALGRPAPALARLLRPEHWD